MADQTNYPEQDMDGIMNNRLVEWKYEALTTKLYWRVDGGKCGAPVYYDDRDAADLLVTTGMLHGQFVLATQAGNVWVGWHDNGDLTIIDTQKFADFAQALAYITQSLKIDLTYCNF